MEKDKKAEAKADVKKTFKGIVVPSEGLTVGTKKQKKYKQGDTFETDNESLYQNLFNRKKIK